MRPRALATASAVALAVAAAVVAAVAFGGGSHKTPPRPTAQIEQGLPADVFASADTGLPWQLHRKGLVTRPVVFTANKLVIVVAHGNPLHLRGVRDLERSGLRIVLAAAGVPVGDYTRKVLKRLGRSGLVHRAVSQETDVREVLSKVVLGEADAGFVYATDAKTVEGNVSLLGIPESAQPRVLYAAAVVRSSKHLQAAKAWVERLLTHRAQKKLRTAGFLGIPR
jgi:molybdate transport system substrate-binding protein